MPLRLRHGSRGSTRSMRRIAHENGWDMSLSILPELKAFAIAEGLYPFEPEERRLRSSHLIRAALRRAAH